MISSSGRSLRGSAGRVGLAPVRLPPGPAVVLVMLVVSVMLGNAAAGSPPPGPAGAVPPGRPGAARVAHISGGPVQAVPVPDPPPVGPAPPVGAAPAPDGVAAPAPDGGGVAAAPGARYAWPLWPAPAVLTAFRAPEQTYGPGHRGVDLAGAIGQPVLAARGGTVVFAGPVAGREVVSVQHADGLRTTYEPVSPLVAPGAVVRAGEVLGRLRPGHAGCPGPCLHWGVRRDHTEYLDPLVLLTPPRMRLLPVPATWADPPR